VIVFVTIAIVILSPLLIKWMHSSKKVAVSAEEVRARIIRDSVLASGNLIYKDQALLSPEVIGRVTEVLVKDGDHIERGQVVLKIDDQTYRDAVAQQEATLNAQLQTSRRQSLNVETLRIQYDRIASLTKNGFASRTTYDNADYGLRTAKVDFQTSIANIAEARAALQQARELMAKTVIRSPMAGTVVLVGIKAGETAVPSATGIPGSSLVTIADRTSIMADLNVDESDVAHLRSGQSAAVHCPVLPNQSLHGLIFSIALSPRRGSGDGPFMGDPATGRSYSVKVIVDDPHASGLLPGMNCRAQIFTSNPPPMASVPVQAVLGGQADGADGVSLGLGGDTPAEHYVFVDDGGIARKRKVELGTSDDRYQQIKSGLRQGEIVITGPYRMLQNLVDGDSIVTKSTS
jgi:HlyD family secretion protein